MLLWLLILVLFSIVNSLGVDPEQIHLAYAGVDPITGYPSGITVSWATRQMPSLPARVRLGKDPSRMNITAVAETVEYFDEYMHHHARITDLLDADTEYFYAVGDQEIEVRSETFSFRTHKNSNTEKIRVAVIGDMGLYNSTKTIEQLRKVVDSVDFVWHLGDISYADDDYLETPLEFKYEEIWNKYMKHVQKFASHRPYMVLPGNHEAECHSPLCKKSLDYLNRLSNFSAFNHRFKMPYEESGSATNMWYSFNLGSAHFVSINTETDFPGAPKDNLRNAGPDNGGFGDQLKWLENDLRKADAARKEGNIPWIIVSGHRPIYSLFYANGDKNINETIALQAAVEELFKTYRVDLYLCGHVHGYERQYPMYKNVPSSSEKYSYDDPKDTIYIVNGAAGNVEGLTIIDFSTMPSWNILHNFHDFGYGIIEFSAASKANSLEWSYFTDDGGKRFDRMTLRKTEFSDVEASVN